MNTNRHRDVGEHREADDEEKVGLGCGQSCTSTTFWQKLTKLTVPFSSAFQSGQTFGKRWPARGKHLAGIWQHLIKLIKQQTLTSFGQNIIEQTVSILQVFEFGAVQNCVAKNAET